MVDLKGLLFATPEKRVQNITEYLAQRKFDRARQLVQNGLKEDPNFAPYHLCHFELEALENHAQEARFAVERYFRLQPKAGEELSMRFEQIRAQVSNLFEYWDALAGCEIRRKNLEAAAGYLKRLTTPEAERLFQRTWAQCEKVRQGPADQIPANTLHFYRAALLAEQLGKGAEAAEAYTTVIGAVPGDIDVAAKHIQAAVGLNARLRELRAAVGDLYHRAGRADAALKEYQTLLKSEPALAPRVLERAREAAQADSNAPGPQFVVFLAQSVLRRAGEALDALEAYAAHGAAERNEAIKHLAEMREAFAGEARVSVVLGRLYLEAGDVERSLRALGAAREGGAPLDVLKPVLDALLARDPANVRAHELLGEAAYQAKNFRDAALHMRHVARAEGKRFTLLSKAVVMAEADPGNIEALLLLAELAKGEGQAGRSGVVLRRAIAIAPERAAETLSIAAPPGEHPQAHLAAVECATAAGDAKRALGYLAGFFASFPKDAPRALRPALDLVEREPRAAPKTLELLRGMGETPASAFAMGEAARMGKLCAEAFTFYRRALALAPEKAPLVQEAMETLLRDNPEQEALRLDLVDVYFSLKLHDRIPAQLDRLCETAPQHLPRIVEKYKEIRKHLPRDAALAVGLMRALVKARTPKAAAALAVEIMPLVEGDAALRAEANLALGDAFRDMGETAKAAAHLAAAGQGPGKFPAEAAVRLEGILKADPACADALAALGRLYAALAEWNDGVARLRALHDADPARGEAILRDLGSLYAGHAPARLLEARIHASANNAEKAAELLVAAGTDAALLEESLREANALLAGSGAKSPRLHLARGTLLGRAGRAAEAARDLDAALRHDAANLAALVMRAASAAADKTPSVPLRILEARAATAAGRPKDAVAAFSRMSALPPEHAEAARAAASNAAALIEHDGAAMGALAHEAFRLNLAEDGLAYTGRALGPDARVGADFSVLQADLDAVLRREPRNARYLMTRASLHAALESWQDAVKDLRDACEAGGAGTREDALMLIEDVRKRSRRFDAAALEADTLAALGRWKKAFQVLSSENVERFPPAEAVQIHLRRGMALEQLGEADSARKEFQRAYDAAPDAGEALRAVRDHAAAMGAARLAALETSGKLAPFSENERALLQRFADASVAALIEESGGEGGEEKLIRVKALLRAWEGNISAAEAASERAGALRDAAHYARRRGEWARAAAILETLAGRGDGGAAAALPHAYRALVGEALLLKPRAVMGVLPPPALSPQSSKGVS